MKLFLCALLSAVALASIGLASNLKSSPVSGSVPIEISVASGTVGAGNTVSYRVTMDGASNRGQLVAVTATSGAYSSLPAVVVVPAYSDNVVFEATISNDP